MNFALKRVYIKSNWFGDGNNKYKKIGHDGFNMYINLFKFRIYNQEHDYTFITSISLLRKETGYSAQKVYELIRLLDKNKIVKVNISRWERLFESNEKLMDDKVLIIQASDKPNTYRKIDERGKERDFPVTEHDYYISLDLPLMKYYLDIGLSEKYFGLHCLLKKMSNNTEAKSWMSINKMAKVLGIGDKSLNQMIYELNRKYLLASYYRTSERKRIVNGKKVKGKSFEHHVLYSLESMDEWVKINEEHINKNIIKWDKKIKSKEIIVLEDEFDDADNIPDEIYLMQDEWELEK